MMTICGLLSNIFLYEYGKLAYLTQMKDIYIQFCVWWCEVYIMIHFGCGYMDPNKYILRRYFGNGEHMRGILWCFDLWISIIHILHTHQNIYICLCYGCVNEVYWFSLLCRYGSEELLWKRWFWWWWPYEKDYVMDCSISMSSSHI